MQYRMDIDGLRALAVVSILIFHINPYKLTGGFVGVDVFFVISGVSRQSIVDTVCKKIRCVFGLRFVDFKQPFVSSTTAF